MAESIITRRKSGTGGGEAPGNYSTWVVADENGAKYEVLSNVNTGIYNGVNTYEFNRWVLNNSATGNVVLNNTSMTTGSFIGNNTTFNENNISFVTHSGEGASSLQEQILINNQKIYAKSSSDNILVWDEKDLIWINSFGVNIRNYININNGFIYGGSNNGLNNFISKYSEDNLTLIGNTVNAAGFVTAIAFNDGFVYVGHNNILRKYREDNLFFVGNAATYAGIIRTIAINDGHVYIGGTSNIIRKYNESTLSVVANSLSYGGNIRNLIINNSFIYAVGNNGTNAIQGRQSSIRRYREDNLAFVNNSVNFGNNIVSIVLYKNFIYISGQEDDYPLITKHREDNLQAVATIDTSLQRQGPDYFAIKNDYMYVGHAEPYISVYTTKEVINPETYYAINKVKVGV
jgi:hypothetical protein